MGEVFLAYDRSTQQPVALKIVREESRMPGDDEALRQELLLARSVSHPNVCRVHDLAPSAWGPILVMEHIAGQTLHTHIRRRKAQGGYTADEFRKIASEVGGGPRGHPRTRSGPRRSEAGQRHGDQRPRDHPRLRLRPGARASQRAPPGRPARRRHAELHGARALALRRREPRRRHLRAGADALGDVDLPRPGARLPPARQADALADHVRRAGRAVRRRGQTGLPLPERRSGAAPAGAPPALLQPELAHHQPGPDPARARLAGHAARARSERVIRARRASAARHLLHQRARGRRALVPAEQAGDHASAAARIKTS